MGALIFAIVAFSAVLIGGSAQTASPMATALATVGFAVLAASVASGAATAVGVTSSSLGALAAGLALGNSPLLAGAVFFAGVFAERVVRVRTWEARGIATGLALVSGAIFVLIAARFGSGPFGVRLVSAGVAAILALLPFLIPADDRGAYELAAAAGEATGDTRALLLRAADLRRESVRTGTAKMTATQPAWNALLRLVRARQKLGSAPMPSEIEGRVVRVVEERIEAHVTLLTRAHAAARAAEAAELSLDDAALSGIRTEEIAMSARGEALVEVQDRST